MKVYSADKKNQSEYKKMHQSIFGNWKLALLVLSSVFGFTRAETTCNRPPYDIRVNLNPISWGASQIVIANGKNYNITCSASGEPKPLIEWRNNDVALADSTFIHVFKNGTVIYHNSSYLVDGSYQCHATNLHGISLSTKYYIVAKRDHSGENIEDKIPVEGFEGTSTFLKCRNTTTTYPRLFKRWVATEDTSKQVPVDNRIGIDLEGNLRFAYLEKKDSGRYTCSIGPTDATGGGITHFLNEVVLSVKSGAIEKIQPAPAFLTGDGKVKAFLERELTLECFFSGYPLPNITWKDTSNNMITGSNARFMLGDFNRRLTIKSVKAEDEGNFLCLADNGFGNLELHINVNVTSVPIKVPGQGLTNLVKPNGINVILKCQAKASHGESLDKPVWYRNGELLINGNIPDPRRYTFSPDGTQLEIKNITKNVDTAAFQCNIANSEGSTFYDGSLLVIESIIVSRQPPPFTEVEEDDVIDISIVATGDACYPITTVWKLNNQTLTLDDVKTPPLMYDSTTGMRMFNTTGVPESVVRSRLGQYHVILDNNHQTVVVEFSLTRKGAEAVEAAGAGFELWWLAIIIGVLAIIIAILIIVCCVKRNYPRQTYQLEKTELKHNLNPEEELLDQSFQEF